MSEEEPNGKLESGSAPEAHVYTDGASGGSRGPGGYGAVLRWEGKTEEISGGEQNTTNQRMELTAACVALERFDEGQVVTVYSDSSYLINCMRRGWYRKWQDDGWLNQPGSPVANRDLWERLLGATKRHREVRWKKVKGHSKTQGPHKDGNDRADELAVAAKKEAGAEAKKLYSKERERLIDGDKPGGAVRLKRTGETGCIVHVFSVHPFKGDVVVLVGERRELCSVDELERWRRR